MSGYDRRCPPAIDGCTCLCHRRRGVVHFVACCGTGSVRIRPHRDSDGSPKGGDGEAGSASPNPDDRLRKALVMAIHIVEDERASMVSSYTNHSGPGKGAVTDNDALAIIEPMDTFLAEARAALQAVGEGG